MNGRQIMENLLAAHTQQWTDDAIPVALHSCQSAQSGASEEVEKQGLCLVITMMSNGYALSSCAFDFCTKPFVAKVTGRHLYACVVLLCIFLGAEVLDGERNGTPPA